MNIIKFIKALRFERRLKREIAEADRRRVAYGKQHFVLNINGRPRCVSKERIRDLVNSGHYRKEVTIRDVIGLSIYKTN